MKATPTCVPRNITPKAPALLTSSSAYMDFCKLGEGVTKAAFIGPDPAPKRGKGSESQPINESKCKDQEELTEKTPQNQDDLDRYCKKLTDSYYCCPKDDGCGFGKTKKQANLENRVLLSTYCEPFDRSKPFQEYYCCPNQENLSECDASIECAFTLGELNAYDSYDVLTAFPCRHHFKTEGFRSSDLSTITNPFDKLEKTTCPMCRKEVEYYYTGPLLFGKPHTLDDGLFGIQWPKYGIKYEGEFKMGQRNGQGKYTWPDGGIYEGGFKNGKRHGQGKQTHPEGDVYTGEWKDDIEHGQGKYMWPDGEIYEGEFKNGEMYGWRNGQGKVTYSNGNVYEGRFKNGGKHGQGTMTYSNGHVYTGEWKDNKRHGQGKIKFSNGDVYEGQWQNDKRHGKGKYKFADGYVEIRQYLQGELVSKMRSM